MSDEKEIKEAEAKVEEVKKKAAKTKAQREKDAAGMKKIAEKKAELKSSDLIAVDFIRGQRGRNIEGYPYEGEIAGDVMIVFRRDMHHNIVLKAVMQMARIASRVSKFAQSK